MPKLSQNFIVDNKLAAHIVGLAPLWKNDLVIDIGSGTGMLTQELAKICGQVIAVEIDKTLIPLLTNNTKQFNNLTIYQEDFLSFILPGAPYKVFANLPFHITSEIIRKLLNSANPPLESYLIVQKEAARKFSGRPHETQFSLLAKPYFSFEVIYTFKKSDFNPKPEVDAVLLKIIKLDKPLINKESEVLYKSFIKFAFNTWKKDLKAGLKSIFTYEQWKRLARDSNFNIHSRPTDLSFPQWLKLFEFYERITP